MTINFLPAQVVGMPPPFDIWPKNPRILYKDLLRLEKILPLREYKKLASEYAHIQSRVKILGEWVYSLEKEYPDYVIHDTSLVIQPKCSPYWKKSMIAAKVFLKKKVGDE